MSQIQFDLARDRRRTGAVPEREPGWDKTAPPPLPSEVCFHVRWLLENMGQGQI